MNYKYLDKNDILNDGISKTLLYKIWMGKRHICYNPKNKGYKNYGARGIRMYDEWVNNPIPFIEYVKSLENYLKEGYSLDRIDNDGNYEPGNLRWTSQHFQLCNRRKQKSSSGYTGIIRCKIRNYDYWRASIYYYGKLKYLGYHKTKEDALKSRNSFIENNNLMEYKIQA